MKKTLFTFGAMAAFVAGAFGQAYINLNNIPSAAGFNTATSDPNANTGWYNGTVTLQVWTIPAAGNYSLATTINNDAASAATEFAAVIMVEENFTQQDISSLNGSVSTEAPSQTVSISDGSVDISSIGDYYVGTASTLPESTPVFFAFVAETTTGPLVEGALVLDNSSSGYEPSPGGIDPPNQVPNMWPADQNLLLPVPEPATFALAGLGGLSMLFLHRLRALRV